MQYRKFGQLDWESSVLGFGVMRLPLTDDNPANIDEPESIRMIRYAIDHGVNYVDTAYTYHSGHSEPLLGRALLDGYREKVKLATKMSPWLIESSRDFDRYLNKQLERLQTDKIDFYLLHSLNKEYWPKLRKLEVLRWAEGAMADGRIGYLGFSFHDKFEVFKEIVDDYDNWTFCQIQYNYMDVDYQAGTRGLKYAADKGLAVVIMEPLRGGFLSKATPDPVTKVWASALSGRSPIEWALQWVWNHSEVSIVLSGMSTMEQVIENIAFANRSRPGILTMAELTIIDRVRETYRQLSPIPCTGCGYCMPCSNGVEIPRIFEFYNDAVMYDNTPMGQLFYSELNEKQCADQCTECGECVEACPQKIQIPELLQKAHALLSSKK
ncbi:aldo/keto reductase [Chloroflexota bacterium]